MKATLINNASGGSETQSMMSVDMSVDSGPESEYDFDAFDSSKAEETKPR
jgi:hypothetical protein